MISYFQCNCHVCGEHVCSCSPTGNKTTNKPSITHLFSFNIGCHSPTWVVVAVHKWLIDISIDLYLPLLGCVCVLSADYSTAGFVAVCKLVQQHTVVRVQTGMN